MSTEAKGDFVRHDTCVFECEMFCQTAHVIGHELDGQRSGEFTSLKFQIKESDCQHLRNLAIIAEAKNFLASK